MSGIGGFRDGRRHRSATSSPDCRLLERRRRRHGRQRRRRRWRRPPRRASPTRRSSGSRQRRTVEVSGSPRPTAGCSRSRRALLRLGRRDPSERPDRRDRAHAERRRLLARGRRRRRVHLRRRAVPRLGRGPAPQCARRRHRRDPALGGQGYRLAASDGGVFTYGNALPRLGRRPATQRAGRGYRRSRSRRIPTRGATAACSRTARPPSPVRLSAGDRSRHMRPAPSAATRWPSRSTAGSRIWQRQFVLLGATPPIADPTAPPFVGIAAAFDPSGPLVGGAPRKVRLPGRPDRAFHGPERWHVEAGPRGNLPARLLFRIGGTARPRRQADPERPDQWRPVDSDAANPNGRPHRLQSCRQPMVLDGRDDLVLPKSSCCPSPQGLRRHHPLLFREPHHGPGRRYVHDRGARRRRRPARPAQNKARASRCQCPPAPTGSRTPGAAPSRSADDYSPQGECRRPSSGSP